MTRAEIGWKRRTPEGETLHLTARREGAAWKFFVRSARYEPWQPFDSPPLEDWLTLLDGVRRRVGRGAVRRDEVAALARAIRERFPRADV